MKCGDAEGTRKRGKTEEIGQRCARIDGDGPDGVQQRGETRPQISL